MEISENSDAEDFKKSKSLNENVENEFGLD